MNEFSVLGDVFGLQREGSRRYVFLTLDGLERSRCGHLSFCLGDG